MNMFGYNVVQTHPFANGSYIAPLIYDNGEDLGMGDHLLLSTLWGLYGNQITPTGSLTNSYGATENYHPQQVNQLS